MRLAACISYFHDQARQHIWRKCLGHWLKLPVQTFHFDYFCGSKGAC